MLFSLKQLDIIKMCANECKAQNSGELSVSALVSAYNLAVDLAGSRRKPLETQIYILGQYIEPRTNLKGYRTQDVKKIDPETSLPVPMGAKAEDIEPSMIRWANQVSNMTPEEAYQEFMRIHPFLDGNGRLGFILYNWLNGTLERPVRAPEYKDQR